MRATSGPKRKDSETERQRDNQTDTHLFLDSPERQRNNSFDDLRWIE